MTPRGFLRFIAESAASAATAREARIAEVVRRVHLEGVLHQPIETLSKGYKRRVGLAQAILHDPPVLIMDEPTDGSIPTRSTRCARSSGDGPQQGHRALDAHPRGGRGRVHARDHHQPRAHRVRRQARGARGARAVERHPQPHGLGVPLVDLERGPERPSRSQPRREVARETHLVDPEARARGYFATPVAYVFIVVFLLLAGVFTFHSRLGDLFQGGNGQATLQPFFGWHPWLYLFLIPASPCACGPRSASRGRSSS
jgi:hypothetical protein